MSSANRFSELSQATSLMIVSLSELLASCQSANLSDSEVAVLVSRWSRLHPKISGLWEDSSVLVLPTHPNQGFMPVVCPNSILVD